MYKIKLVFIFFIFADAGIEVYYIRENLFILYLVGLPTGIYCAGAEDGFFVSDLSVIDVFEVSGFAVVVSALVVCVDVAAVVTAVV